MIKTGCLGNIFCFSSLIDHPGMPRVARRAAYTRPTPKQSMDAGSALQVQDLATCFARHLTGIVNSAWRESKALLNHGVRQSSSPSATFSNTSRHTCHTRDHGAVTGRGSNTSQSS
jgi:hypothetical protein